MVNSYTAFASIARTENTTIEENVAQNTESIEVSESGEINNSQNDTAQALSDSEEYATEDIEAEVGDDNKANDSASIVSDTQQETNLNATVKTAFYQKWWFTIIILLLFIPFISRYYKKKEHAVLSNLDSYKSKIDELSNELKEKEDYYKEKENDFKLKLAEEKELKFQTVGLSKFSDLISQSKNDLNILGQQLIFELVEYIGANSGAIYTINDYDSNDTFLELLSVYAPNIKELKKKVQPGEGYIGTCYKEASVIELDEIPETYIKIASGLGKALPRYLAFVPLKLDENILGVLEIASFAKLEKYKLDFVEKLSQNIASNIAISHANKKMYQMLEQTRIQAEELQSQEEELRQNLEEMQATQDDLHRQVDANKKMQDDLIKEKALLDAILNSLPDYIYFKDNDSKFIRISHSMLKLFPVDTLEEMIGKSDFDFHTEENAQKFYDEEKQIIKTEKGFVDHLEHEILENGIEQWVSSTKLPLYDETGKCIGTFGISKNVTALKKLEIDAKTKMEEMLSQEEELKQNLEEMQTIQEDLQRTNAENKKIQGKLTKEKALLDAVMNYLPDFIFFKDRKSQFIRVSKSMLKIFSVEKLEEMIGKSDFDFNNRETAQKYYIEEQEIIKSGKSIIDVLKHEVLENGAEQWSSITKMPLYDETGKCIGTFGISKDVTNMKKIEMDAKAKNEELQSQEEELRQNLEEMQATQEELNRQMKENKKIQVALEKENYLMDTLMNNLPEFIYIKDLNSKFIKNSRSHARLFGFSDPKEILGKSDFDFFDDEHARPAFEGEQEIIKTGVPIIDLIEKEVKKDGVISWVTTTKMPLRDQKGKIVGTFGVSKDITHLKKLEIETKERTEELHAQEEELKQNLEEMQTIQEDLHKRIEENEKMKKEFQRKEKELLETIKKLKGGN
jgi:PAS domain S-box-containing protein